MPNQTSSPNMGLTIPSVGVAPGPDWALDINASLSAIDSHNHSSGQGVQIQPSGLNISSDLTFLGNNAVRVRSVNFANQAAVLTLPADLGCVYEVTGDLWYNNGAGVPVQITSGGSVVGSGGSITGLPSGTAGVFFNSGSGTYIFNQATSTPANLIVGAITFTNSGFTTQLQAAANPSAPTLITLPPTYPIGAGIKFVTMDSSGNLNTADNITPIQIATNSLNGSKLQDGTVSIDKTNIRIQSNATASDTNIAMAGPFSFLETSTTPQPTSASVAAVTDGRPIMIFLGGLGSLGPAQIVTETGTPDIASFSSATGNAYLVLISDPSGPVSSQVAHSNLSVSNDNGVQSRDQRAPLSLQTVFSGTGSPLTPGTYTFQLHLSVQNFNASNATVVVAGQLFAYLL